MPALYAIICALTPKRYQEKQQELMQEQLELEPEFADMNQEAQI